MTGIIIEHSTQVPNLLLHPLHLAFQFIDMPLDVVRAPWGGISASEFMLVLPGATPAVASGLTALKLKCFATRLKVRRKRPLLAITVNHHVDFCPGLLLSDYSHQLVTRIHTTAIDSKNLIARPNACLLRGAIRSDLTDVESAVTFNNRHAETSGCARLAAVVLLAGLAPIALLLAVEVCVSLVTVIPLTLLVIASLRPLIELLPALLSFPISLLIPLGLLAV